MVFEPKIALSENAYVIGKVGNPATGQIEQVLLVAGLVLMVPAVLGLMHMLREREVDMVISAAPLRWSGCSFCHGRSWPAW